MISADASPDDVPSGAGLLPARVEGSAFDAPLVSRDALVSPDDGGLTPEQLADYVATVHDLSTPDGWTEAMRTLAGRREVLRRLSRDLTTPGTPPALFHAALKYVTENGVGKPIERHEHTHRGTVAHVHITPPIQWTDAALPHPET